MTKPAAVEPTRLIVKYDRRVTHKVSTKNEDGSPAYGADETSEFASVGIEWSETISLDATRELDARITRAFLLCRDRVLRQIEKKSEEYVKLLGFLERADTIEKLEKLSAFGSEKWNKGVWKVTWELNEFDELVHDKHVLLSAMCPPKAVSATAIVVENLRKQIGLGLTTGDEIVEVAG